MHQEEEKELVRMQKQVKELFEKSKRVYLPHGSTKRSSKEEGPKRKMWKKNAKQAQGPVQ